MKIDDKIRYEKLKYDINREAAKKSIFPSGKIDKYEYVTGEEILPSDQRKMKKQAKFTYSPLKKAFQKQGSTLRIKAESKQKQLKFMENNWLNLIKLLKRILILTEIA